jgi:hypothetical protein
MKNEMKNATCKMKNGTFVGILCTFKLSYQNTSQMTVNKLILGDNLEIMKTMDHYIGWLKATGSSEAGIEFYSWDFNYQEQFGFNTEVIKYKIGNQHQKFNPGIHQIAVKVVDNDGLESIETVKLKINGEVEKIE